MVRQIWFSLYNILSVVALIFYLPFLILKRGPGSKLSFIKERLGMSRYTRADIWLHAVSVGEVIAAIPLLKSIKREFPQMKIVLSTITYTGQKVARQKFSEADRIMYMPWDTSFIVNNIVKSILPYVFITIETEFWPNLFRVLKRYNVQIIVMNGRISPSSFSGYSRIKPFIETVLSFIDIVCVQDDTSAKRVLSLGAVPEKVKMLGNFKFDISLSETLQSWTELLRGPILVAGSTHKGEEVIVSRAFKKAKKRIHDMKLILAPRHPERFAEVEEVLKKEGLVYCRRSKIGIIASEAIPDPMDVILLDTIGELSGVYAHCTVAFVGGSLVPVGGHNILEPAYWSRPILVGPHMDNFPIISDFLENSAANEVKNQDEMAENIIQLMEDKERAEEMGRKARGIVEKNIGAVDRAMEIIKEVFNPYL